MRRFLLRSAKLAAILAMLALALTPVVREQLRLGRMAKAVEAYRQAVASREEFQLEAAWGGWPDPCGNGLVAVLELPKLGATLPVWRDGAMEAGARLVEAPDLPNGGTAAYFALAVDETGQNRLSSGDCLYLQVGTEETTYEIEQVATTGVALVWPEDGGDWCALVAPEAEERLLALARRVSRREVTGRDDTFLVPEWISRLIFAAPVAAAGLIALGLIGGLARSVRRGKLKRMKL